MAVPVEQFVQQLEDSGILAGDTIQDFIPPKASPQDSEELARELVRSKKLTTFQAEEVCKGNAKSLVLGNYVLLEKIGAGGMGQVFKAEHRRLKRAVAIKILPANTMKDPATVARFEREVEAAAKLRHPNIIAADDADCANGVHFLVMELVDGSDLSALVKLNGPFSVDKAIRYILQAATGLEAAHVEGIVHRDVKPANLLLDRKGTVKILDMGLARFNGEAAVSAQAELTSTGTVMGTIDYMAPEQALSTKTADARADIYSLGCSFYYLVTGRAIYDGDSLMAKLLAHRDHPIPCLKEVCPGVTEQIDAVFRKMVAKSVLDRYQTMTEVIAALENCHSSSSLSSSTSQSFKTLAEGGLKNLLQGVPAASTSDVRPAKVQSSIGQGRNRWPLIGSGLFGALILLTALVMNVTTQERTLDKKPAIVGPNPVPLADMHETPVDQPSGFDQPVKDVSAMPAEEQLKSVVRKLVELNPAFDGKLIESDNPMIRNGVVVFLEICSDNVTDISPVRALAGLRKLRASGSAPGKGNLSDLSPLKGLLLESISVQFTQVSDLTPLQEMKLESAFFTGTNVADLSPLKGMPLGHLQIELTQISDLSPLEGTPLKLLQASFTPLADISPLKDLPLESLDLGGTKVSDLSPLAGMPLTRLNVISSQVDDHSALKDLPLTHLGLNFLPERDAEVLRSIKTLEEINGKKASEFLKQHHSGDKKTLAFQTPAFDQWRKDVADLPVDQRAKAVSQKLVELNPEFDGKVKHEIQDGVVTVFHFYTDNVTDISPVRAFDGLLQLTVQGSSQGKGHLIDLSPLKGMPLKNLNCARTQVTDLSPLEGMPLVSFACTDSPVSDLSPLKETDLTYLFFSPDKITQGIPSLRQMKSIVKMGVDWDNRLSPEEFWKRYDAGEFRKSTP